MSVAVMRRRFVAACVTVLSLAAAACADPTAPGAGGVPKRAGMLASGAQHFYFLPPLGTADPRGSFLPELQPVVQVCRWNAATWDESSCAQPVVEFTRVARKALQLKLDVDGQKYYAKWQSKGKIDISALHRIRVLLDSEELGHVDVAFAGNPLAGTADFVSIPTKGGVPIEFRIEQPGLYPPPLLSIDAPESGTSVVEGTSVTLEGSATDALGNNLASAIAWSSDLSGALGTGARISISSLAVGDHEITASVSDAEGRSSTATIALAVTPAAVDGFNRSGTLSGPGSVVTHVFDGRAGDLVNVAFVSDAMCGRAEIRLKRPDGTQAASALSGGYSCRMFGETGIQLLAVEGQYTVEVRAVDAGSTGPYEVGISWIAEPAAFPAGDEINEMHGVITVYGHRRFYKLTAEQYEAANVLLSTPGTLAAYVRVRRPGTAAFHARPVLASERTTHMTKEAETGRFSYPVGGEYIIEVYPNAVSGVGKETHVGEYRVRLFAPAAPEVTLDSEVLGTFDTPYAFHRYRIPAAPGDAFVVRTVNGVNATYLYSTLYSATGVQLQQEYSGAIWGVESTIGPRVFTDGALYIEQNPTGAGTGTYRQTVVRLAPPTEITSAMPWRAIESDIDIAGRRRYYAFEGTAGQVASVDILLPAQSTLQGAVRMYRQGADFVSGTTLSDAVYGTASAEIIPGRPRGFSVVLPQTGRYVIEVRGPATGAGQTGPYELRFNVVNPAPIISVGLDATSCPGAGTGILRGAVRAATERVQLCAGSFFETRTVMITTAGLVLRGAGATQSYVTSTMNGVLDVRAADVTIESLGIGIPPLYNTGSGTGILGNAAAQRLTVQDCRIVPDIRSSATRHQDEAIFLNASSHDVTVQRCQIQPRGESLSLDNAIRIIGNGTRVLDNEVNTEAGSGTYWGIHLSGSDVHIARNLVGSSVAVAMGYAITASGEGALVEENQLQRYAYGIFASASTNSSAPGTQVTVRNNVFRGTTSSVGGSSGAILVRYTTNALVENNAVLGFPSTTAVHLEGAGGRIVNNRLTTTGPAGGIVLSMSASLPVEVVNNTLHASSPGAVIYLRYTTLTSYPATLLNNIIAASGSASSSACAISSQRPMTRSDHNLVFGFPNPYCDVASAGANDISANPLFADADLRLGVGSPAIDAGTLFLAPTVDFEGTARPQGARPDIGAHERRP